MNRKTPILRKHRGFALIATILLMVLLAIITVGALSLSVVTLRSGAQDSAQAKARANARMALMIAIGELQKQMGPDQRISANADILDLDTSIIKHRHWTGAWNSWKAGENEASQHSTIAGVTDEMAPTYDQPTEIARQAYFRKWLVSLNESEASLITTPKDLDLNGERLPSGNSTAIQLVGEGSLGQSASETDFVNARLLDIKDLNTSETTGRYAWWVGDESQKARIMDDSYLSAPAVTDAEKIYRSQAPGSMGTKTITGLELVTDDSQFAKIPSRKTLDLVPNVQGLPAQINFHHATPFSYSVLSDVREGGLKRDLNTILEQPINLANSGNEYMLYRFGATDEDRVPIQDLSAYYQLYKNNPTWEGNGTLGGIQHNVAASRVMQVSVPDYGADNDRTKYLRQYTSLYRNPVPIKVQFVVGVGASNITATERAFAASRGNILRASDKYKLLLGVKPVITLWNPSNLPMVMGTNASQIMRVSFPPFVLRWKKYRTDGAPAEYLSNYLNLNYSISNESTGDGRARSLGPYIMQVQFARTTPIVFQPGEVKMFTIPVNASNFLESGGNSTFGNAPLYQAKAFVPDGFYVTAKSAPPGGIDVAQLANPNYSNIHMVFGDGDKLDFQVVTELNTPISRAVSGANEVKGSAFHFSMVDAGLDVGGTYTTTAHFRNYQFISRFGLGANTPWTFNRQLMLSGFPNGQDIPYEGDINAIQGSDILAATANGEAKALLNFFMMAGCETNEASSGGTGAGRRTTARPFIHGSTLSAPQISGKERKDLYDYNWEWQVNKINELDEAFHDDGNSRGFYGGGYTSENGTTHIVQQYLPALPPISIASLSSAHLGGFSLANNAVAGSPTQNMAVGNGMTSSPTLFRTLTAYKDLRQVTATGQGGLAPHTLQAIGNSYAHPNIPADQAFTNYTQLLNMSIDTANPSERTYADHSYLANKALWDEFFFSSITPQSNNPAPNNNPLFGGGPSKSALEVASDFLFDDELLPNRRFTPYTSNLSSDGFEYLKAQYADYSDGFADKIAAHLMITGALNINSTSVEAWKVFFASLKGKPLSYLQNQASSLQSTVSNDTPVAPGILPNGEAVSSSELSADANAPADQWTSSRSITDDEIDALAKAMVYQVKLRGPFLSLSEFINRRLDGGDKELALKGALQAAIDEDGLKEDGTSNGLTEVTINAAFRTPARSMDSEIGAMTSEFPEALKGPIAYGSTPYVDQADILRQFGTLLTPRGDTFVIRAYGDSLDANGKIQARAWCEAVVQRTPDYVDSSDENQLKQESLASPANRQFGRIFKITQFRWLNDKEI